MSGLPSRCVLTQNTIGPLRSYRAGWCQVNTFAVNNQGCKGRQLSRMSNGYRHVTRPCSEKLLSRNSKRHISISELDEAKKGRERVVILGSGWAGYTMAGSLDHRKHQVIIVSPRSYFVFTPLLASTSVGTLEFRTALEPIRTRRSDTAYFQAWADDVDFKGKTVTVEEAVADPRQGRALLSSQFEGMSEEEIERAMIEKSRKGDLFTLAYDKLVVSVGSYIQTFNTPGVKEHAHFLKDVGDSRQIRKRILECFEAASLPTVSDEYRKQILTFAIVGGGPTGMEFSAELHDFIHEDLSRLYPELAQICSINVYDVAPNVLSAFDEKLGKYATETFKRHGIAIKTSRQIEHLELGLPGQTQGKENPTRGFTLSIKDEKPLGIGMCVWSTGLMMNPFIEGALKTAREFPASEVIYKADTAQAEGTKWTISRDPKTGSIMTNDRLRVILKAEEPGSHPVEAAYMKDVFALGDCAIMQGTSYPATAQVANQKGVWLAKRLNKGDLQSNRFTYRNLGIMAYIGNRKAIVQGGEFFGDISGRTAWLIWRGAYLVKSLSWRNRILIPIYWFLNAVFGRDVSRF